MVAAGERNISTQRELMAQLPVQCLDPSRVEDRMQRWAKKVVGYSRNYAASNVSSRNHVMYLNPPLHPMTPVHHAANKTYEHLKLRQYRGELFEVSI